MKDEDKTELQPAMASLAIQFGLRHAVPKKYSDLEEDDFYTRLRETYMHNQILLFATGAPEVFFTILHQMAMQQTAKKR